MLCDIYNWNHLLSVLRLLHQCVFTLQPLEQHSKQIYRKPKANPKKERKNLSLFNMQFYLVTLNILLRREHAKKDGLL